MAELHVEALLDAGADPTIPTLDSPNTGLKKAANSFSREMVTYMISRLIQMTKVDFNSTADDRVASQRAKLCLYMPFSQEEWTPLFFAMSNGYGDLASMLIPYSNLYATILVGKHQGGNIFHLAAEMKGASLLSSVIEAYKEGLAAGGIHQVAHALNIKTYVGFTPAVLAMKSQNIAHVKKFITLGASPILEPDEEDRSPEECNNKALYLITAALVHKHGDLALQMISAMTSQQQKQYTEALISLVKPSPSCPEKGAMLSKLVEYRIEIHRAEAGAEVEREPSVSPSKKKKKKNRK